MVIKRLDQITRALWWAAAVVAVFAVIIAGSLILLPLSSSVKRTSGTVSGSPGDGETRHLLPSLESLQELATRPLRAPLVDAPPPVVQTGPATAQKPSLPLKLLGTAIEPGDALAILLAPTGELRLLRTGDHYASANGDAIVTQIAAGAVTFEYAGDVVVLSLPLEGSP